MSITSGIVLFSIIWFVTLFMVLPLGIRNQEEGGDVVPGTSAGAPHDPMMKKKLKLTSIIAVFVFIGAYAFIESGIVTIDDIASVTGYQRGAYTRGE